VSLNKLTKKLKRDAQRSPKKAAALGLLCVVALWFWAPLVWGWIAPEDSASETTAATAPGPNPGPTSGVAAGFNPTAPKIDNPSHQSTVPWQTILEHIDRDPRKKPARLRSDLNGPASALLQQLIPWSSTAVAAVRDPFERPKPPETSKPVEDDDEAEQPKPIVRSDPTPAELEAKVTSTIGTGDGRGVAIINGRVYRRGDEVQLSDDRGNYAFKLTAVHGWGAVLTRNEKEYPLEIPVELGTPAGLAKRDQSPKPAPIRPIDGRATTSGHVEIPRRGG